MQPHEYFRNAMNGNRAVSYPPLPLDALMRFAFDYTAHFSGVVSALEGCGDDVSPYHSQLSQCFGRIAEIGRMDSRGVPSYAVVGAVRQLYSGLADLGSLVVHNCSDKKAREFGYWLWGFGEHIVSHSDISPFPRVKFHPVDLSGGSRMPFQK